MAGKRESNSFPRQDPALESFRCSPTEEKFLVKTLQMSLKPNGNLYRVLSSSIISNKFRWKATIRQLGGLKLLGAETSVAAVTFQHYELRP